MIKSDLRNRAALVEALPPLREIIAQFGLRTQKSLGQHFLLDLNLTTRIVKCAGDLNGVHVIEIGPGPGGLSRALVASAAASVTAIEKDERCIPALTSLVDAGCGRLKIIHGDALHADLTLLSGKPRAIIANLPYNVGTAMLMGWLKQCAESSDSFLSMTLMFQAEVVDRLIAQVGDKAYGRLSVITQFCCNAKRVMTLPARAFTPPPQIDSAVVHLTPRLDKPEDLRFEDIEVITAAAFGQRRKMLRSSLKPLGGEALLAEAGIEPTRRAEELPLEAFETLARVYAKKKKSLKVCSGS